jgi:(4-O-methyl)-D-glucuronate---lignin esterase
MIHFLRLRRGLMIFVVACLAVWFLATSQSNQPARAADAGDELANLERDFLAPPDTDKPWAYWWWLKGNVSEASITRDLEAMKSQGFAGLLMFDSRGYHEDLVPPPESRMEFMSAEWRRMLKFAMSEANRLGLEMSVNLSSCAGALKGPWLVGDEAPKKLLWKALEVQGPRRLVKTLEGQEMAHFREVMLLAARAAEPEANQSGPFPDEWQPVQTVPKTNARVSEVVDLSGKVDRQGRLTWDVPEGRWTLFRFASAVIEGHEYDVDVLDETAVEAHFERMGKAVLADAGPLAGKTLTHFYSVSWEGAMPTWSPILDKEFQEYRGYSMRQYMPVLAGMTVKSREVSDRFLRDYYKTLGDCFRDNFYGKLHQLSNREGIKWHAESGGPWDRKLQTLKRADQLAFLARTDMPQGEFWHPYRGLNRPPAMVSHVYGKRLAATEAFTHMQAHWSAYPAVLKPAADKAFCDGVNHFIWHTFSASPPEFGKPGIEYFAGTHINPNVTWFDQSGDFLAYLARCQVMLRKGHFVADVCCYTGDNPYLHWGRGTKWSESPSTVLGKGYAYDLVNDEVLLERMAVEDGDLVLPDGMRYRVLVVDLDDETVSPTILDKIIELTRAGATVVLGQRRPTRAPGLHGYPTRDTQVGRLAAELWGSADETAGQIPLGKGRIIRGTKIDDVLQAKDIAPDFEGPWDYIHRRATDTDIYFLAGSGQAECVFRVSGKEPELWDPETGLIRDAVCYHASDDGRTVVPICLPENGSVFVVFRTTSEEQHLVSVPGPDQGVEIEGCADRGVELSVWQRGRHVLRTSEKRQLVVKVNGLPDPQKLTGPWEVRFARGMDAPESIVFDVLTPWNKHANENIRYFSGTAVYRKTFELDEAQAAGLVRLQLGNVGHIAEVRVNGSPKKIVWTAPWTVDLTGIVKAGSNQLEIDVTNTWVNRLVGDTQLPPEKRFTKTNVGYFMDGVLGDGKKLRAFQGFSPKSPLMPSGLLGPVRLEFGSRQAVEF